MNQHKTHQGTTARNSTHIYWEAIHNQPQKNITPFPGKVESPSLQSGKERPQMNRGKKPILDTLNTVQDKKKTHRGTPAPNSTQGIKEAGDE